MMKCSGLACARILLTASIGTLAVTLAPPSVRGGVLLQGYYQQRNGAGVPSPADGAHPGGDSPTDFWWDHLAKQAKALREAGFTALWVPPVWKGASGTFSVGFDVFDDYDLGSKNQKGTLPTRYGTREQLERCVAIFRANGATITVDTGFGPNVKLHDYTGHSGDVQTDGGGQATIAIPRNTNGLGYVCYSRDGIGGAFPIEARDVTQDYEGAGDLDIQPADNTAFVQVCRVFVDSGQTIKGELRFDATGWTNDTSITLEIDGPGGGKITSRDFDKNTAQGTSISANAAETGFYTWRIRSAGTPATNSRPAYKLTATYRAPRELQAGQ